MVSFRLPGKAYLREALARNLAALLSALVLAFSLWSALRAEEIPAAEPVTEVASPSLSEFRTEREQIRQMLFSELNALIHGENASPSARESAEEALLALTDAALQEGTIASVLRARGYEDALVTVEENSVNVVLTSTLTPEEAAMILEIVVRETGQDAGAVKIIALN